MNSIDTRIAIGGMAAVRSQSDSHPGKRPASDSSARSGPHAQPNPAQMDVSFSTYGSNNEHVAVMIKDRETGEVIREIPSREMQKLHTHLEVMA